MRVALPSLSNPNRAVLATGAWPEINGVTNNGNYRPPPVDSVFSLADAAGLSAAVAGSSLWKRAFGRYLQGNIRVQTRGPGSNADIAELVRWQEASCVQAQHFLKPYSSGLLVVGIPSADAAGHDHGGESEAYREVARAVDRCLGSLVESLDSGRTAFVVASDHGHIQRRGAGGHGGTEEEVVEVPLVLAGRGIRQNHGWSARMIDVAPTICALLGLPLPSTNQGDLLWPALDMDPDHEAQLRRRAAQQQSLAASKLPNRPALRPREKSARLMPGIVAFLLCGALVVSIFVRHRTRRLRIAAAAGAYFATYYLLFFVTGLGYSLSHVGREEHLLLFLGANVSAAGAAFLASSLITLRNGRGWIRRWDVLFASDLALLIWGLLGLRVAWIYWTSGLFMNRSMLDLDHSFEACLHLLQFGGIAFGIALLFVIRKLLENQHNSPAVSAR